MANIHKIYRRAVFKGHADLGDSEKLRFGDSQDVTAAWDGTDLDILASTDDYVIKFGSGTKSFDIWFYGNTASDYMLIDASAGLVEFVGAMELRLQDTLDLNFGTGSDAQARWSTGDADNHSFVIGLGDSNQALHVTDKGAIATDWNVAADTHPTVYVHSNTTPATDYMKVGAHTGSAAWGADLVGAGTLNLGFDGLEALVLIETASAVNHVQLTNAATNNDPTLDGIGDDTNVGLILQTKGTGQLRVALGGVEALHLHDADANYAGAADTAGHPLYLLGQNAGTAGADTSGTAGADLFVTAGDGAAGGAHTANNPNGGAGGSLILAAGAGGAAGSGGSGTAGGDGMVYARSGASKNPLAWETASTALSTAGNETYTAAQFRNGVLLRDPAGGARTDTTPTAALLVAAYPGVAVGDTVEMVIVNTADAAENITIANGTGVTLRGSAGQAFGQNTAKRLLVRFTNVTASSEAVDLIAQ